MQGLIKKPCTAGAKSEEKMNNIFNVLKFLDVSSLTRAEWITVGMALKEEGYPCDVWEDWSRDDSRYHSGECEKLWGSFKGSANPVKGGTIIKMAKQKGWKYDNNRKEPLYWDDTISYDGISENSASKIAKWDQTGELYKYIDTLFSDNDVVSYVSTGVKENESGKFELNRGIYTRTAGEIKESLKKYPDDIGATIGDWNLKAGAWIRFNPVDGKGIKNENVVNFKFALVESDIIPIYEQERLLRSLELPIAALVNSGGKSIHAIVHIDAENHEEYTERVDFLYEYLEKNGLELDKQNRNPSRLSRMPGVTRNGKRQHLIDVNIGKSSWNRWIDYINGKEDGFPEIVSLGEYKDNLPTPPAELIHGILRKGHKMLISGSSKAGKSFLLMELAIAIAEGKEWLGFKCEVGKLLYVNLEIDPNSCIDRFYKIYEAAGIETLHLNNISIWNLRGHAIPMDELVPILINRVKNCKYDAIIIDPIYKVITGDENNASDMGKFCNQFDKICSVTGCAAIYCHHHSKGVQGGKRVMDRASGSGVFARDPDAQLDIIQLALSDEIEEKYKDLGTAWRMESSLREFENIEPVNFWFKYPIHTVDETGELQNAYAEGSRKGNLSKSGKKTSAENRKKALDKAFNELSDDPPVKVSDIAKKLGLTDKTIHRYIKEFEETYWYKNGIVGRKDM